MFETDNFACEHSQIGLIIAKISKIIIDLPINFFKYDQTESAVEFCCTVQVLHATAKIRLGAENSWLEKSDHDPPTEHSGPQDPESHAFFILEPA